jgi:1,4-dihydroxy-2-naphthoate octaprenyltransferase
MTQASRPTLSDWTMAARPRSLPAAAAPVFVGIAIAMRDGVFHWPAALACFLISMLMQIGANFANDLFDHERGSDTADRLGPTRVTASGLISAAQMRFGIGFVFGLAVLLGFYLTWLRGWPVLALGLTILVAALAYSGGPFPYGYYALGDIFVFLSFGMAAVCGTYFVLAGSLKPVIFWAAVPMGLLIVNILVVNNTRDIATDAAAKKRTLAVYFGRRAMLAEYLFCLIGAYMVPLGLWFFGLASYGGLLSWLSLPQAFLLYHEFSEARGRQLNKTLGGTAQLALTFAVLFALGILIFR